MLQCFLLFILANYCNFLKDEYAYTIVNFAIIHGVDDLNI